MGDPANLARKVWSVTFNSVELGYCDGIDPTKLKLIMDPIHTGSTGDKVVLGPRILGLEGSVDVMMREINRTGFETLNTHYASGDSIPLSPAKNTDTYTLAKLLTLHPVENAADTSEDINILKAYAIIPALPKREGKDDDGMSISFEPYPDRTILASSGDNVYGYIGPVPA